MFTMAIVIWVILPAVLIPLCIYFYTRERKYLKFLQQLLKSGRISEKELGSKQPDNSWYFAQFPDYQKDNETNIQAQDFILDNVNTADNNYRAEAGMQYNAYAGIYNNPAPDNTINNIPAAENTVYKNYPTEKKQSSALMPLMFVGAAFIVLAGIIFSAAAWVYMNTWQRTGIILLASVFFAFLSFLSCRKLKIETTGIVFCYISSALAIVSYFTYMYLETGNIFRLDRSITHFIYSFGLFLFAALMAAGFFIFRKRKAFFYTSLYSVGAAVSFLLGAASAAIDEQFTSFAFISVFFFGLLSYLAKKCLKGSEWENTAIKTAAAVFNILQTSVSSAILLAYSGKWDIFCIAAAVFFILQCAVYGGYEKKYAFKILLPFVVSIFSAEIVFSYDTEKTAILTLTFACFIFAAGAVSAFVSKIRTPVSDFLYSAVLIITSFIKLRAEREFSVYSGYTFLVAVMSLALFLIVIFSPVCDEKKKKFRDMEYTEVFRLAVFIPAAVFIFRIMDVFYYDIADRAFSFDTYKYIITAIAAAYIPLIMNLFLKNEKIRYGKAENYIYIAISAVFAFLGIIGITTDSTQSDSYYIIELVICGLCTALLYLRCALMKNKITVLVPNLLTLLYIDSIIDNIRGKMSDDVCVIVNMALCAVVIVITAVFFRDSIYKKSNKGIYADVYGFLIPFLAAATSLCDGNVFTEDISKFISIIEFALFALMFCRRNQKKSANLAAVTVSIYIFAQALINRPFFVYEGAAASRIVCIILMAAAVAVRFVWRKENRNVGEIISFIVSDIVMIILAAAALRTSELVDFVIIISAALIMLGYSVIVKRKKWLMSSVVVICIVTIYSMREFLAEIGWWFYLLIIGAVLIGAASMSEYFLKNKKDGERKKLLKNWKW